MEGRHQPPFPTILQQCLLRGVPLARLKKEHTGYVLRFYEGLFSAFS